MLARIAPLLFVAGLVGCGAQIEAANEGASRSDTGSDPATTKPDSGAPSGKSTAALTADGTVSVESGATAFALSLAILPRTFSKGGLYGYEGASYPATPAAREAVVDSVAFTYPQLAAECAARHPEIVLPKPGDPQSVIQAALEAVADCSYADFGIKPYWIPRLVVDVDVCARKLGAGWRLPTVADVTGLTADERAALAATKEEGLYNGPSVYVLGADGTVQVGDLFAGTVRKLSDTTTMYLGDTYHYEGGAALRCIRR